VGSYIRSDPASLELSAAALAFRDRLQRCIDKLRTPSRKWQILKVSMAFKTRPLGKADETRSMQFVMPCLHDLCTFGLILLINSYLGSKGHIFYKYWDTNSIVVAIGKECKNAMASALFKL
jgi:hypothetical protein